MILEKLILDDFLTYEHLEHTFEKRPLMVQGLNLTDENQHSNGSGKSGMQTGIEFCITASNSRDVRDGELVSFGQQQARAQLIASCDVRKERLHIDWTIKVKGSNQLTLLKQSYGEAWEEVSFSNVNDGKKYILDWFAITREDLFNYYIINKTRFRSFFKSSNKEKVDLINRFSDASIIDGLEKIDNTLFQSQYDEINFQINKIDGKLEYLKDSIETERQRDYAQELKVQIDEIHGQIATSIEDEDEVRVELQEFEQTHKKIKKDQGEIKIKIAKSDTALKNAKALVDDFKKSDWDKEVEVQNDLIDQQDDLIDDETQKLKEVEKKSQTIDKLIKSLSIEMSGAIVCPSCSHEFVLDCEHGTLEEIKTKSKSAKVLLDRVEEIKQQHKNRIDAADESIAKFRKEISKISTKSEAERKAFDEILDKFQSISRELLLLQKQESDLQAELRECEADIKDCKKDIERFKEDQLTLKSSIDKLKQGDGRVAIKQAEIEIKALKKQRLELEDDLTKKGDEIYKRNQWINNFKQFRMNLANQSLEAIEFHSNRYLSEMGSDLKIKMDGFKLLANGTIKDEITAMVIRNVERSFSSFSGGEQGRLLFASILANRYMINSTHPYGGLDFLSIDEVFEGIDAMGLKFLVRSAKQLGICVILITHVTDEEVGEDTLLIVKEGGVSRIQNKSC